MFLFQILANLRTKKSKAVNKAMVLDVVMTPDLEVEEKPLLWS